MLGSMSMCIMLLLFKQHLVDLAPPQVFHLAERISGVGPVMPVGCGGFGCKYHGFVTLLVGVGCSPTPLSGFKERSSLDFLHKRAF